jgi:hypothetical protein
VTALARADLGGVTVVRERREKSIMPTAGYTKMNASPPASCSHDAGVIRLPPSSQR